MSEKDWGPDDNEAPSFGALPAGQPRPNGCGLFCWSNCDGEPHLRVVPAVALDGAEACEDCAGTGRHLACKGEGCDECRTGLCIACEGDGDDQEAR